MGSWLGCLDRVCNASVEAQVGGYSVVLKFEHPEVPSEVKIVRSESESVLKHVVSVGGDHFYASQQ